MVRLLVSIAVPEVPFVAAAPREDVIYDLSNILSEQIALPPELQFLPEHRP